MVHKQVSVNDHLTIQKDLDRH